MQNTEDVKLLCDETVERMNKYRTLLLDAGMCEPTKRKSSVWHWRFYREETSLTAFIVNLQGKDTGVEVVFGFASTAFTRMAGDENALVEFAVDDDDINIREKVTLRNDYDEEFASTKIQKLYDMYCDTEKDELLKAAKEKRKEFIHQIAIRLKPLGFKKKANTWTRPLEKDYYLMFNAQKSSFADSYYFNVYIGKYGTDDYGDCFYTRVAPEKMYPMDWQLASKEQIDYFLDKILVEDMLSLIINTPLKDLGKMQFIWEGCLCDRERCEMCWVEKNLWESNGTETAG